MPARKLGFLLFGALFLISAGLPAGSTAGVNVNIGVFAPPPVFRISAPPPVVVIPGTYVYAVPDIDVDILFHGGSWYRPHDGHWYRAKSYNGPWTYLAPPRVPRVIVDLPPDYRRMPPGHQRIPYGHFKKNWGRWERERHWDRDERWREGRHGRPDDRGHDHREGPPQGRGNEGHGGGGGHGGGRGR